MERGLLDKAINGALLGKRKIGRPIRYNLRTKGKVGYVTDIHYHHSGSLEADWEIMKADELTPILYLTDISSYCSIQEISSRSTAHISWDSFTHTWPSWLSDSTSRNAEKSVSKAHFGSIVVFPMTSTAHVADNLALATAFESACQVNWKLI